jgi:putative toxin-antitoxin system antitoxin component (TIGR02293 family)
MAKFSASPAALSPKISQSEATQPATHAPAANCAGSLTTNFLQVFQADAMEQVRIVKLGVPARTVEVMAKCMAMPKEKLVGTLGLARATVDRKARGNKALSSDESSKVLGMARLVGQVQAMVEESGNPAGFNAAEWVARWLQQPLPALKGQRPGELMDTPEGQGLVSQLVARMQSGAYS